FREAKLHNASFVGGDLEGADFRGALLDGTNFTGASVFGATFAPEPQDPPSVRAARVSGSAGQMIPLTNEQFTSLSPAQQAFCERLGVVEK
ncbi:MAG: pentapeptide repeat-containing protein, partial [Acidobacteriota bacterium]